MKCSTKAVCLTVGALVVGLGAIPFLIGPDRTPSQSRQTTPAPEPDAPESVSVFDGFDDYEDDELDDTDHASAHDAVDGDLQAEPGRNAPVIRHQVNRLFMVECGPLQELRVEGECPPGAKLPVGFRRAAR